MLLPANHFAFRAAARTAPPPRPYESGEVIVQPYNTLLTLSHLADVSDGLVLLENEALHRTAAKLYGIARPSFGVRGRVLGRAGESRVEEAGLKGQSSGPCRSVLTLGAWISETIFQHG